MSFKSNLATMAGKSSYWFLHNFMGGGSSLPGKITTKIDPDVLHEMGKNYDVIIVSGTNGKTLTTALIVQVLQEKYDKVLTNKTGSNMVQGIVSTFLESSRPTAGKKGIAVLEVDEANVKPIVEQLRPKMFVLTNIFRDQLDRYGEIYTTYQKKSSMVSNWLLMHWLLLTVMKPSLTPKIYLIHKFTMELSTKRPQTTGKLLQILTESYVPFVSTLSIFITSPMPTWEITSVRTVVSNDRTLNLA